MNPKVCYGYLPNLQSVRHSGGGVKIHQLAQVFPQTFFSAHVLYLVTSALPPGALAWAKIMKAKGARVILNQNGVGFPAWCPPEALQKINERNRKLLKLADHVFYQSEFCRRACDEWVGSPQGTSEVLYNPVELSTVGASSKNPNEIRLLVTGSHHQAHRVLPALQLVQRLKERHPSKKIKLRIGGTVQWKNAESDIHAEVQSRGIVEAIEWFGPYDRATLSTLYQSVDLLLHLQDKDASPTVPLEAMAHGVPVVGLASGALPELVSNEVGTLLKVEQSWDRYYSPSVLELVAGVEATLERVTAESCQNWVKSRFGVEKWIAAHQARFQAF